MSGDLNIELVPAAVPNLPYNYMPAGLAALRGEETDNRLAVPMSLPAERVRFKNFPHTVIGDPEALSASIALGPSNPAENPFLANSVFLTPPVAPVSPVMGPVELVFAGLNGLDGTETKAVVVIDVGMAFWNARFRRSNGSSRFADIQYLDLLALVQRLIPPVPTSPSIPVVQVEQLEQATRDTCLNAPAGGFGQRVAVQTLATQFPRSFFGGSAANGPPPIDGFWHGTAVADLAAGADEETLLFGVELPLAAMLDYGGDTLQSVLPAAFRAALRMTEPVKDKMPIIVVLAFACPAGPHDGTHPVAGLIAEFVKKLKARNPKNELILPAGNHRQDRCCARLPAAPTGGESVTWSLAHDDNSPNTVEICIESGAWTRISLQGPGTTIADIVPDSETRSSFSGPVTPTVLPSGHFARIFLGPDLIGGIHHLPMNGGASKLRLSLARTKHHPDGDRPAPAGDWTITVAAAGTVNLWILRDDRDDTGRVPSVFSDPAYRERNFDGSYAMDDPASGTIRRSGTASIYTTAKGVYSVGADERAPGQAAAYSGKPFGVSRSRRFPLKATVVVDEREPWGGQQAVHNGTSVIMENFTGTSAAAAMKARVLP